MRPTLRQLATFLATVETGSVTAAARRLNLTQPAASQQLRELERTLGVRLLERAGGRAIPTAAGQAVLAPAQRARTAEADVIAAAAGHRTGEAARVRLGTGATACIYLLPPILAELRKRMPGLDVTIATGNTPEILRRMEAGELDIAVITLPNFVPRSLTRARLRSDPLLALLPRAMAPVTGTIVPSQLTTLPLVLYETGSHTRSIIDNWFRRAAIVMHPIMELGSVEAIKVVVAGGLGASILPALALSEVPAGTMVKALRPSLARTLGYVLRREKVVDRGLRATLEALHTLRTDS